MFENVLEISKMIPGFLLVYIVFIFFSDSEQLEAFDIEISPNNVGRNIPLHVSGTKLIQINCVIQGKASP